MAAFAIELAEGVGRAQLQCSFHFAKGVTMTRTFDLSEMSRSLSVGSVAEQMPKGGYFWSIASLTGAFLREAEQRYLPRDQSWTFLGVQFTGERPMLWYPRYPEHKQVIINLTARAATDLNEAIFELAMEVIHSLALAYRQPSGAQSGRGADRHLLSGHDASMQPQYFHKSPQLFGCSGRCTAASGDRPGSYTQVADSASIFC